jgi:hypothetical protein
MLREVDVHVQGCATRIGCCGSESEAEEVKDQARERYGSENSVR